VPSESQPERNVPPPSHRRKPAAYGGTLRMPARDERAICGVERASSRGDRDAGQPVERSKSRVGHGESTGYVRYDENSVVGGRKGDVLAEIRWRWRQNDFNI